VTAALVGRERELERIGRWFDAAAANRRAIAVIRGEPGIGKSAVAAAARDEANRRAFRVLATHGGVSDTDPAFAALLTLLHGIDRDLDALAGDHASDVRAALALGRVRTDPVSVQIGVFRVLAGLAEQGPLALIVDDADRLDTASARALGFALGRLDADPVAALLFCEGDVAEGLVGAVSDWMFLNELDRDALHEIVHEPTVDSAVADAVVQAAAGNPLVAIEMVASLTADQRAGRAPLPAVPRPPAVVGRGFAARLGAVPESARRALVVVAADGVGDAAVITMALAALGESPDGLDEAEAAGLLVRDGARLRLVHPLLRSFAYHQVAPASQRAAHRALATAYDRPEQAAARAWQLAAAAGGVDEPAAAALDLVARDAARRGDPTSAARALERAADLSPNPVARMDRRARAVAPWLEGGSVAHARDVACTLDPTTADLDALTAMVAAHEASSELDAALAVLARSGRDPSDPGVEALRAGLLYAQRRTDDAVSLAIDVGERADGDGDVETLARAVLLSEGLADFDAKRLDDCSPTVLGARAYDAYSDAAAEAGFWILPINRPGDVRAIRREARVRLSRGDVQEAEELVTAELELEPVVATTRASLHLVLEEIALLRGLLAPARPNHETTRDPRELWLDGRWAMLSEPVRARELLGAVASARPAWFTADAATALVACGDETAARELVERHAHAGEGAETGPLLRARRARALGVTGLDRRAFAVGLNIVAEHGLVIEEIELMLACALRGDRDGDTATAAEWRDRARRRCRETGLGPFAPGLQEVPAQGNSGRRSNARAGSGVRDRLSAAELRVAEVVSTGLTNRQAAEALFLSVKTVDFHLQQIYRKLEVRSRTELAVLLTRDEQRSSHDQGDEASNGR